MSLQLDASVVIASFNTRDVLRDCLATLYGQSGATFEVFVVDNGSRDGSADMVSSEFPSVRLLRSPVNLGFAGANNLAFRRAQGRYVVLLNSDAFLEPGALARSVALMDENPAVGLGGARLAGRDGSWQPSARMFPGLLNDWLVLTGLSARYSTSRLFGRGDRTWSDPLQPAAVDWVPGAFSIIRNKILADVGYLDESLFLYYEDVDICRRIRAAGHQVWYWPEIVVTHIGGESSRTVQTLSLSEHGSQLTLWRMRAAFLYYRKHHGSKAAWAHGLERLWHSFRRWKNAIGRNPECLRKAEESRLTIELLDRAWRQTAGGRVSPARPW